MDSFRLCFCLIWLWSSYTLGPSDDAPKQRAVHFKKLIVEFKNKSWSHFAQDKLGSRRKFDPKELIDEDDPDIRSFSWTFWLGATLIRRSLLLVFESIRKLDDSHKTLYSQWSVYILVISSHSLTRILRCCVQHITYHLSIKQKCRCFVQMQILNHQILNVVIGLVQELI